MAFDYTNYERLEYIQSTGTQYIGTGYYGDSIDRVVMLVSFDQIAGNNFYQIFGGGSGARTSRYVGVRNNNNQTCIGNAYQVEYGSNTSLNTIYEFDFRFTSSTLILYLNGTQDVIYNDTSSVSSSYPYNIFAGGSKTNIPYGKLYKCSFYLGSDKLREYIPARRKSDSVLGLYDIVNEQFYTNSGTGTFNAGPDATQRIISITTNPSTVPTSQITVSPSIVCDGDTCSITYNEYSADGRQFYAFRNWSQNGSTISQANPYSFTVNGNASYTCNTEKVGYCILL